MGKNNAENNSLILSLGNQGLYENQLNFDSQTPNEFKRDQLRGEMNNELTPEYFNY